MVCRVQSSNRPLTTPAFLTQELTPHITATGKQGGSVVDALLSQSSTSKFTILAVTRDANSSSAAKLAAKSPSTIKLVQGNMDDVPALFASAKEAASDGKIWGVYSVQISMGKGVTHEGEIVQGKAMIDESVKQGVSHFVYSSVDRGGDEKSWTTPTPIPHFASKYEIEHHLRDHAGSMGWTILRPVAFCDNLEPGFPHRVFMTALSNHLGEKKLQWVATRDIGFFAAKAFAQPEEWNHKAVGLAGDELNVAQLTQAFKNKGVPSGPTFWFLGSILTYMVGELGIMIKWFGTDGYGADIPKLRKMNPSLMTMEDWLVKESKFQTTQ